MLFSAALLLRIYWTKAIGFLLAQKVRSKDILPFRTNGDDPLSPVMLGLVSVGPVEPDFRRQVDVAGAEIANILRTTTGDPLKTDHIRHDGRQMGQCGLYGRIVHGLHWIGFTSL